MSGLIVHDTVVRAGNQVLGSFFMAFRQDSENALRRQALLDIKTRNDCAELIVKCHLHQAISNRRAPDLLCVSVVGADAQTARVNSRSDVL